MGLGRGGIRANMYFGAVIDSLGEAAVVVVLVVKEPLTWPEGSFAAQSKVLPSRSYMVLYRSGIHSLSRCIACYLRRHSLPVG